MASCAGVIVVCSEFVADSDAGGALAVVGVPRVVACMYESIADVPTNSH